MIENAVMAEEVDFPLIKTERIGRTPSTQMEVVSSVIQLPEILFLCSYPPRECGIATYSQDLIKSLNNQFSQSFKISICALETEEEHHIYNDEIKFLLNTHRADEFLMLAKKINEDPEIIMIMIQHEFGFFEKNEDSFSGFLEMLNKPVIIVFHTVLPRPDEMLKLKVRQMGNQVASIIVMTHASIKILKEDYGVASEKITLIPHGTHLVPHLNKNALKNKYGFSGKRVLSTFGLLSSGKNIETTLEALPSIIKIESNVLFLIIGKTHPSVIKKEGEKYRNSLSAKITELNLQAHVKFVNCFLPLPELLEYLQLTDIYMFTSRDPNQAVSGTFSYAMSCGCPLISTPIPHAVEVLGNDAGLIIDFGDSVQLEAAVINLLSDEKLRMDIASNGLQRMAATAWENAAIAHATLFEKMDSNLITLNYKIPAINLSHLKKMTTAFGIIQFSIINQPDINSGYTLDDNARAMVALCLHFELSRNEDDIKFISIYLSFIKFCLLPNGKFLNYVNEQKEFTEQNFETNLDDSNGRAIWALGYLISIADILPNKLVELAISIMQIALVDINRLHSTRAMAFTIKGLYYLNIKHKSVKNLLLIENLANRLTKMYLHEANGEWKWFEGYLTYANSIIPEAMLCAWLSTGELQYREIAKSSCDFLLEKIFNKQRIQVISNRQWLFKDSVTVVSITGGEQPIDVAYTILALNRFYEVFKDEVYYKKLTLAFNWFLGNNHLHQIMYNPCTGGCYDGLEENNVNLNQGAESTVSYLMARLTVEKINKLNTAAKLKIIRPSTVFNKVNYDKACYIKRQVSGIIKNQEGHENHT